MNDLDFNKLKESAIELAVAGKYQEAIETNQQILKQSPKDPDIVMQLAHAYWQLGELTNAEKYYLKALKIDPNNNLAKKKIVLLNALKKKTKLKTPQNKAKIVSITELIEEPGITKIIRLSIVGKPEHISLLSIGEEVFLKIKKRKIGIRDLNGNYVGCLPDDLSKRLIQFIKYKTKYEAFVFSIEKNEVKVFIREVKKPRRLSHTATFTSDEIIPSSEKQQSQDANINPSEENEEVILNPEEMINKEVEADKKDKNEQEEQDDTKIYQEYEE